MLPGDAAPGATRMRLGLDGLRRDLLDRVALMTGCLGPRPGRNSAQLALLVAHTHQIVHAGHRLLAEAPQLRAADEATATRNQARQMKVTAAWAMLNLPLARMRLDLNSWSPVETMIRRQIGRVRRALIEPAESLPDTALVRDAVSDLLFAQFHSLLNDLPQDAAAEAHGCFADIPLSQSLFLRQVHAARRCLAVLDPGGLTRFLDVGCGAGLKVISAAPFFDRAAGLEYDPGYADMAARLFRALPHDRCRIMRGDALHWDGWEDYHVLYFFRPLRDDAAMARLEQRIALALPPGRLLIAPYRIFATRAEALGCAHVAGHVWLTGHSPARARQLRRAAELIGTDIPVGKAANVPLLWDPLVQISRRNGYELQPAVRTGQWDRNA